MNGLYISDLSDLSPEELAPRVCDGLFATRHSEGERSAICSIPRGPKSLAIDAFAVAERDAIPGEPHDLAMQIYLDGRPVGKPALQPSRCGPGRVRATAGVTLLVSPGEDVEISAAITSKEGAAATRVHLLLSFH